MAVDLVDTGGRFMTSAEMEEAGTGLGLPGRRCICAAASARSARSAPPLPEPTPTAGHRPGRANPRRSRGPHRRPAVGRAQSRPEDGPARAAHLLALLRELRGALHFCALRAEGLDVPIAVLGDPRGGPERLLRTGWPAPMVDALKARAAASGDLRSRWDRAQAATDPAFGHYLDALSADELSALTSGIATAEQLSRASPEHQRRAPTR